VPDPAKSVREGALKPWRIGGKNLIIKHNALLKQLAEQLPFDPDVPWQDLPAGDAHGHPARRGRAAVCLQAAPHARTEDHALRRGDRGPGGKLSAHRQRGLPRPAHDVHDQRHGVHGMPRLRRLNARSGAVRWATAAQRGAHFSRVSRPRRRRRPCRARRPGGGARHQRGADRGRRRASSSGCTSSSRPAWLPDPRPRLRDPVRRRGAARAAGDAARHGPDGRHLRAGRAQHRPASARQRAPARDQLKALRDRGNTVLVVEHDEDTMRLADELIELGPEAGTEGGQLLFQGTPAACAALPARVNPAPDPIWRANSSSRARQARRRRTAPGSPCARRANNLRGIDAKFPMGLLTCVTGVSAPARARS
jgi:excinuclease ABC subunit A